MCMFLWIYKSSIYISTAECLQDARDRFFHDLGYSDDLVAYIRRVEPDYYSFTGILDIDISNLSVLP